MDEEVRGAVRVARYGCGEVGRLLGRRQAPVFRLVHLLHPWAMTEVYLLGLIVAWVKLKDLAQVHLGLGIVAFVALIVVMVWAEAALEPHEVWERVQPQLRAPAGGALADRY